MDRRKFISGLAGAAALPFAVRAQAAMPVIGCLSGSTAGLAPFLAAFREGLGEQGFVDGKNVTIEYRSIDQGQYDRLPALAAELIERHVSVLFANPIPAALAAKAAAGTTPMVFAVGSDPVGTGLVSSMNRPGGNVTGVTFLTVALAPKRLELVRELVPKAERVGLLVNPSNPNAQLQIDETSAACATLGLQLDVQRASEEGHFESAFDALKRARDDALIVSVDPFLSAGAISSLASRPVTPFRRSIRSANLRRPAASSVTARAFPMPTAKPAPMSAAFSKVKSPATCRWCSRPSTIS
jgi:putative ABC transport system substrate-binding protein